MGVIRARWRSFAGFPFYNSGERNIKFRSDIGLRERLIKALFSKVISKADWLDRVRLVLLKLTF